MPEPLKRRVAPAMKLEPVRVTEVLLPKLPLSGAIEVRVGGRKALVIVKGAATDVPAVVEMVIV